MEKVDIDILEGLFALLRKMKGRTVGDSKDGLLLVSVDGQGQPNVMTLTIADAGIMNFGPTINVYVREPRYTHDLLEENGDFTLNLPRSGEMGDVVSFCGKATGRKTDKFQRMNLTAVQSRLVKPPVIGECGMHFECSALNKYHQVDEDMCERLRNALHGNKHHSIFTGLVEAAYADADIAEQLSAG